MSNPIPTSTPHIQVVSPNTVGTDYVIGDVHGYLPLLQRLITEKLSNPNNRLFIVGDLIDRGPESAAVIETIMAHNKGKNPPQIYVVRGNHEEDFLKYHKYKANSNNTFVKNYTGNPDNQWVLSCADNKLNEYAKWIESLPYIIHVNGDMPFNIVHADMPFDDNTLNARIKAKQGLTESEINYATWARDSEIRLQPRIRTDHRSLNSTLTFVGHNIAWDQAQQRPDQNCVNLDTGACITGGSLVAELPHDELPRCTYHEADEANLPKVLRNETLNQIQLNGTRNEVKNMANPITRNLQSAFIRTKYKKAVAKNDKNEMKKFYKELSDIPIQKVYSLIERSGLNANEVTDCTKGLLLYQLENLEVVHQQQRKLINTASSATATPVTAAVASSSSTNEKSERSAEEILLTLKKIICSVKWQLGFFGGTNITTSEGISIKVPKNMASIIKITNSKDDASNKQWQNKLNKIQEIVQKAQKNRSWGRDELTQDAYNKLAEKINCPTRSSHRG